MSASAASLPAGPSVAGITLWERRLGIGARVAGAAVAALGLLIVLGWALDTMIVPSGVAAAPMVKANTGSCLALVGLGLALGPGARAGLAGRVLGALAAVICGLTLIEYALGVDLGIDTALFADASPLHPGRMAPNTAAGLLLCGLALALPARRGGAAGALALTGGLAGWLAAIGVAADLPALVQVGGAVRMALPTALGIVAVGLAIAITPGRGTVAALVASSGSAGPLVRRLSLTLAAAPPLIALALRPGLDTGLLDGGEVVLILVASITLLSLGVSVWFARSFETAELERSRSKERERAAERRSRAILETSGEAFISMDTDGVITAWNAAAARTFGWKREDAIGRTVAETIVPPAARAAHREGLRRFLAGGEPRVLNRRLELDAVDRSGRELPIELTISATSEGGEWRFHAFLREIAERRRYERALEASEQRFRELAEWAPAAIFERDLEDNVTYANSQWLRLTGIPAEEAAGLPWIRIVDPQDAAAVAAELAAADPAAELALEFRVARPDGAVRAVRSLSRPLRDESGAIVGRLGAITDLTAEREAAAELARSNAELEQFAYVASHDLQEPLRVIGGFVELLRARYHGRLDGDADRFIDATVSGVERMRQLIDDLLHYSRVGRDQLRLERIDSAATVAEALAWLERQIAEREVSVDVGPLPVISGDPRLLDQLFRNLIANAIKFADPERPRISVSATQDNGAWRFTIADNGSGIEERHRERIFEMFKRLHGRSVPGTGIGLAVCRRAVERHGGRIWVESEPGAGSEFHFTVRR